jgi:aspartyl-tRNA(Asn)/glutamyl-tRNA(Gln) amidotransferase subunit C
MPARPALRGTMHGRRIVAITRSEVLRISALAKLHFDEAELDEFTAQFQHILDYIEKLKEIDVAGVAPTSHVSLRADVERQMTRADEVRPSLGVEEALRNAPDQGADHFRVPKVI